MSETSIHTPVGPLAGKRVLVTGGTTGIGRAIAALLASYAARVFIFGRHEAALRVALEHVRSAGGECQGMTADVADPADLERVFTAVDQLFGGLDILVANAGVWGDDLEGMDENEWRYTLETDLVGAMATAREAAKAMHEERGGQIVLVGSISADNRGKGSSVYVAAKAGLQGFAQSFRREMAEKNIRVSLIEPGSVGSDLQETPAEEQREKIRRHEMLRAEDIAVCVHYILTQPERCDVAEVRIEPRLQSH
jgi:NADP-dependent 3-hydroxy acid dehydrogenase YdfG